MTYFGFEEGKPWCPLCEEYDHSFEDCPEREDDAPAEDSGRLIIVDGQPVREGSLE